MLAANLSLLGASGFAILTHDPPDVLQSLSVRLHNLDDAVVDRFLETPPARHPVLRQIEQAETVLDWRDARFLARLSLAERSMLRDFAESGLAHAYSQRIPGALSPASCTLIAPMLRDLSHDQIYWSMRCARVAFHWAISLQRPRLSRAEQLSPREHQAMTLATVVGLRPQAVAQRAGVSVNTIRTFRQNALARMGANSIEQAVWRMIETGQLFVRTPLPRPRKKKD